MIISTIRNPYDSIISSIKIYNKEINKENIKSNIDLFKKYGGDDIIKLVNLNKSHLILKYEDFHNNFDILIDNLELFFNTK